MSKNPLTKQKRFSYNEVKNVCGKISVKVGKGE